MTTKRTQAPEPSSDPVALARYELELADVYITDIWRVVFGDKPMPRRPQALQRIMAACMHVDWPRPRPSRLPIGVVPDDG